MNAADILVPLIGLCLLAGYISFILVIGSNLGGPVTTYQEPLAEHEAGTSG